MTKTKTMTKTATLTAKTIRAAAASVAGARNMGITTAASEAAPALLERAEAVLSAMIDRAAGMEPSAPDEADERRYYAAAGQTAAYMAAVDELRAALGLETHAATLAVEKAANAESARAAREQREADETAREEVDHAEREAAEKAQFSADFAAALPNTVLRFGECYDQFGRRVALIVKIRYAEGRMSSLGGWNAGGDECGRSEMMVSETGRIIENGEWVSTRDNYERQAQGNYLAMAGCNCVAATSAGSDWLPGYPAAKYNSDWDCQSHFDDAFAAAKASKAAAKAENQTAGFSPFAALAALKRAA